MNTSHESQLHFGHKLKWARKKKKLTQEQLAEKIAVHRITISRWESEHSRPSIIQALSLKELLDLTMEDLALANWITDPKLTPMPILQLQNEARRALQSFSLARLVQQAPGLPRIRLQALLRGEAAAPIEIQYLRNCLGREFQPFGQTYQAQAPRRSSCDLEEQGLIERIASLEALASQLRQDLLNRKVG